MYAVIKNWIFYPPNYKDKNVTITLPFNVKTVIPCNLVEEENGSPMALGGNVLPIQIGHHAIETYKLVL